ncbi:MAG: Rieske (2Fe-2S) protein [Janthinobacterium lividum]
MTAPLTTVAVAALDDIPIGEGRAFAVDGRQIAIFRLRSGVLRAVDAVCPHRGGPLADGLADEAVVVCPLHGHTYDLSTGQDIGDPGLRVCAYETHVDSEGTVFIDLAGRAGR